MKPELYEIKHSCARCKYLVSDQFSEFRCQISNNTINKRLIGETICDNFLCCKRL